MRSDSDIIANIRTRLNAIVGGLMSPREGLRALLYDDIGRDELFERSGDVVGDAWGIEALVGDYHSYGDVDDYPEVVWEPGALRGDDARRVLDDDVLRLAREWLELHGA